MSTAMTIRGATVVDGTGAPSRIADVHLRGGVITHVGDGSADAQVLDAAGLVVAPGFIDMHSHSDVPLLHDGASFAKTAQGVTTEILGQDGLSFAPAGPAATAALREQLAGWYGPADAVGDGFPRVDDLLQRLDGRTGVNVGYLVPHGTLRIEVMGYERRAPTRSELDRMAALLDQGMRDGAFGMSSGLSYVPGGYADNDELIHLCRVVAAHGGYYCPHHRNYGSRAVESYRECLDVAAAAGCALHLAHLNMNHDLNRGRAPEVLTAIDDAVAAGLDITFDSYPYLAGNTMLAALLPSWAQEGGTEATLAALQDPGRRARIREELEVTGSDGAHGMPLKWERLQLASVVSEQFRHLTGRRMDAAAAASGIEPFELFCRILDADRLATGVITFTGNEENAISVMSHRRHCAGSDGILEGAMPHPRGWGTFPRYLAEYVRRRGILTLEECVRHMTGTPAARLGLPDRGRLAPGCRADLVLFDPATIADTASYENPTSPPTGIALVMVNGIPVVSDGEDTGNRPGQALRSTPASGPA